LFYVPLKNFSLIGRRNHCRWRVAKFRLMLGAQGLWAGRDLYRATPTVSRDLGFSGLIRRTAPFSRLLRLTMGCARSILTRIHTGHNVHWKSKEKTCKLKIRKKNFFFFYFYSFDFDPTVRHTFWALTIGGMVNWIGTFGASQHAEVLCPAFTETG
jgi:hypothetical protein